MGGGPRTLGGDPRAPWGRMSPSSRRAVRVAMADWDKVGYLPRAIAVAFVPNYVQGLLWALYVDGEAENSSRTR